MAAVSDSTLAYLSQEPIFKLGVDEDDYQLQFLRTLTLNFNDHASDSDSYSYSNQNCDFDSDSDGDSSIFYNVFYTDVHEGYLRDSEATDDVISFAVFEANGAVGSDGAEEELGLGFRAGVESSCVATVESRSDGLRVAGIGSDSDSEENENDGVGVELSYGDDMDPFDVLDCGLRWDSPELEDRRVFNGDSEWEEVNERSDDETEAFGMLIDGVEQLSVPSEISSEENSGYGISDELARDFDWAVLLSVNNLTRVFDFHHDSESNGYLSVLDDNMSVEDYGVIFRLLADDEIALYGNPPAAKSAMDNLPTAVLMPEYLGNNDDVHCAVCKDEIALQEKVVKLLCCHYFHGECILPWLSIRNTCPVCRYELPTDDPEYEQRKSQRVGGPSL